MPAWLDISIFALAQVLMLVGLFGLLIPVFPGLLIMWIAALGYGFAMGFEVLGIVIMVLITLLAIIASLIDNVFMGAGARKMGASWGTIVLAIIAGVIGTLVFLFFFSLLPGTWSLEPGPSIITFTTTFARANVVIKPGGSA